MNKGRYNTSHVKGHNMLEIAHKVFAGIKTFFNAIIQLKNIGLHSAQIAELKTEVADLKKQKAEDHDASQRSCLLVAQRYPRL